MAHGLKLAGEHCCIATVEGLTVGVDDRSHIESLLVAALDLDRVDASGGKLV